MKKATISLSLLVAIFANAQSQDTITTKSIEEVSINGVKKYAEKKSEMVARMPLKNLENPQVYTVVPKELLEERVAVDLKDALFTSPGVTNVMLGVGSGGTGLSMLIRGFSGADGAGSIRNGMATNFVSLSDPVNLERLEVIKGPSSTLFGTTLVSYGGLVNRVTKQPLPYDKTAVSVTGGGYSLGRVTLDFNRALNPEKTFLFRLNTAIHREKSFQDQGVNKTFMVAPSFKYLVNDKLTLALDMEYFQSERNSTYVGLNPNADISNFSELNWDWKRSYASNDITSKANVVNIFANANYKINEHWTSDTRFSYSNTDNDANYLFLLVGRNTTRDFTLQRRLMSIPSTFNTIQFQQNFNAEHNWGSVNNKLLIGLDYTQLQTNDTRTTINSYDTTSVILNQNAPVLNVNTYQNALGNATRTANSRDTQTFSAYVSDVVTFFDRLNVMASLRADRFHDRAGDYQQTSFSPKFGVVYQVLKDQVSIFGNWQNGFKNVSPNSLATNPNITVKPEQANQLEGGVKFELLDGKLNGTVSYYNIKVKDKVRSILDSNNVLYAVQDGTQSSKGFEMDLIANPVKGLHILLGYGYNESKYEDVGDNQQNISGKRPAGVPQNSANYWASYKFSEGSLKNFGLGFGGNISSAYYFNDQNTVRVDGFHTMDATVFYEMPKYRFAIKVNNLSNEKYWTSTSWAIQQQTRTFLASLSFNF
ncbi:TonB-dependent siderophore receptor [Chryseobacterium populi]|nr:TonB-dependent receptor [Chryseobacterium populi]